MASAPQELTDAIIAGIEQRVDELRGDVARRHEWLTEHPEAARRLDRIDRIDRIDRDLDALRTVERLDQHVARAMERGLDRGIEPPGRGIDLMLVGVVLVGPSAVDDARASLRGLLLPGQRRVHTAKESPRRRRVLLDTIARIDGLTVTVLRLRRPAGVDHVTGRRLLLDAAATHVVEGGVSAWTLDDTHPPLCQPQLRRIEWSIR